MKKKKKKRSVLLNPVGCYTWITAPRYIRIKVGSSYHTIFDYFWNTFTGAPNKFWHRLRSFFLNIPGNAAHRICSLSICLMSLEGRGSVFLVGFFAFAFIIKERMIHKSTRLLIHPPSQPSLRLCKWRSWVYISLINQRHGWRGREGGERESEEVEGREARRLVVEQSC